MKTEPSSAPDSGAVAPRLALLGAAILFSTGGAAIKTTAFSGPQVASLRCGFAALALGLAVVALPGLRLRINRRTWLVGLAYAATLTLYALANKMTSAASVVFLQASASLYLLLLGPRLLGERWHPRSLVHMVLLALGLGLIFLTGQTAGSTMPRPVLGNLLGALGGFSWAWTVLGLRWLGRDESQAGATALGAVLCGNLLAFGLMLPVALPVQGAAVDWVVVAGLGLFQVALAYLLVTWALRRVPALDASLLLLVEPVLNPVWAWLLHGERAGLGVLAGGALILLITLWRTARPAGPDTPDRVAEASA